MINGMIPPQALDLEEAILGALMIDTKGVEEVIDFLTYKMFYKPANQFIFKTISDLYLGIIVSNSLTFFLHSGILSG